MLLFIDINYAIRPGDSIVIVYFIFRSTVVKLIFSTCVCCCIVLLPSIRNNYKYANYAFENR